MKNWNDMGGRIATMTGFFVAGAAIGGATALLLAPQPGRRTRRLLQLKVAEGAERLSEAKQDLAGRWDNLYSKGRKMAKAAAASA